jgi:hypothetical protein
MHAHPIICLLCLVLSGQNVAGFRVQTMPKTLGQSRPFIAMARDSSSIKFDTKKFISSLVIGFSLTTSSPLLSEAAERTNPEAIEVRRVSQQPIGAPEPEDQAKRKPVTLPSGVQYFDVVVGDGPEVAEGKSVQFQWVSSFFA